jgi:hygromycin-B 4-O-kinase
MIGNAPLDGPAANDFLARRYGDRATRAVEIGRGAWAAAYGFMLDGEVCVARLAAQSDDFTKDQLAAAHSSPALPIPRVLEIGEAPGGFYAITERAYGGHLDALDEAGMRAALPSLFAAFDAMRLADVSRTSGYGMWGASGNAPHATWQQALLALPGDAPSSRIRGWRDRMNAYPAARAALDEGLACLRSLVAACPPGRHLIHSDPLNGNILVAGGQITAVLDWGCGMYGDFLYDLSHLTFSPCWFPAWRGIDFAAEAERHYDAIGLDVPLMRERLRCYEIHIGLEALAYNVFCQRPAAVDVIVRRTLESVRR